MFGFVTGILEISGFLERRSMFSPRRVDVCPANGETSQKNPVHTGGPAKPKSDSDMVRN